MRNTNKRQGFTIVELVIVIAVIAILAGVLIPTFSNVIQKAKDSRDQQDALNIYKEQVLALKADNELEDTNKNGKEEVLVVLRENQTDVKYFLFVDGKMELKTTEPESAEYDLKISNGTTTPGEEVVTYTLTKVTQENLSSCVINGNKIIISSLKGTNDSGKNMCLIGEYSDGEQYFGFVDMTIDANQDYNLSSFENVSILTLEESSNEGFWYLKTKEGKYVYKKAPSQKLLYLSDTPQDEGSEWKIYFVDGVINIESKDMEYEGKKHKIKFNNLVNSYRFSGYTSKSNIELYIIKEK